MFSFFTPWKDLKTFGFWCFQVYRNGALAFIRSTFVFLTFEGCIERDRQREASLIPWGLIIPAGKFKQRTSISKHMDINYWWNITATIAWTNEKKNIVAAMCEFLPNRNIKLVMTTGSLHGCQTCCLFFFNIFGHNMSFRIFFLADVGCLWCFVIILWSCN